MIIYLIILLVLIGLLIGLLIWIRRLFRLYKKGGGKSFTIQVLILTALMIFVTWKLQIFPLSKNFYFKDRTTELTGQKFWSWEEYDFEEIGVRGEGYTLDIYKFSDETAKYFNNPDEDFFNNFPPKELADIKWKSTPVSENEQKILEFVTPSYSGWKKEIEEKQYFIRQIASQPGAYYSYDDGGSTNFYIIAPEKRLVILINHNM